MRKSSCFLLTVGAGVLINLAALVIHPLISGTEYRRMQQEKQSLIKQLDLTDLCLFTEARYTRHLALADLHSAFQDHPMSFDYFPSGSFVRPSMAAADDSHSVRSGDAP